MSNDNVNGKPLVISHGFCKDGMGAAYAAWKKFGDNAEYLFAVHGDLPPDVSGRTVYVLDFAYERQDMIKMHEQAASLFVLDHHETAALDLAGLDFAVFDQSKSGAVLAWEYFVGGECPDLFKYVQDQDLLTFKYEETRAFMAAVRRLPMDFSVWDHLANMDDATKAEFLREGREYHEEFLSVCDDLVSKAVPFELNGIVGLAVNGTGEFSTEVGNRLAELSGTFGAVWHFSPKADFQKRVRISLRSSGQVNVRELAETFGGGGHDKASGCGISPTKFCYALNTEVRQLRKRY